MKLKSKSYYYNLKRKYNDVTYSKIWHDIAGRNYVGSCSKVYEECHPKSYQEFFDKYELSSEGRTCDQLMEVAKLFQKRVNDQSVTLDTYFDVVILHVVIETVDGKRVEETLRNYLTSNGCKYFEPKELFDTSLCDDVDPVMGVDLIVKNQSDVFSYIQVKPFTAFKSNNKRNPGMIADRANFFDKQEKFNDFLRRYPAKDGTYLPEKEIYYMIYDNTGEELMWFENCHRKTKEGRNRLVFSLSELCGRDGLVAPGGQFGNQKRKL